MGTMTVRVVVDNRVRVRGLPGDLCDELRLLFTHDNPAWHTKRALGLPTDGEPRLIETWEVENETRVSFPRGGMSRVRTFLREKGYAYVVEDLRSRGAPDQCGLIPDQLIDLYPFQAEMRDAAIARENCYLRAGTGAGKTCIAFGIAAKLKVPTLVLLPNAGLLEQWQERAESELGLKKKDLGLIRGPKWDLRPLTLALPQTLSARKERAEELNEYFGALVMDEIQIAPAKTFFESVNMVAARYRVGISADESRKDRKEFLCHDLFGDEPAAEKTRQELIDEGYVLDVQVRVVPTDFRADWYGLPDRERELDFNRLLDEMMADPDRAALLLSMIRQVQDQCIVFAHRREHCRTIDRELSAGGMRTGFLIGGDDYKPEFRKTAAGLKDGTVQVGVGTFQAAGTGIDLPKVGLGVAATPIAGNRQFFGQVRGRLCRIAKGKKSATLIYLWDRNVYPRHLDNLVSWNNDVKVLDGGKWVDARHHRSRKAG